VAAVGGRHFSIVPSNIWQRQFLRDFSPLFLFLSPSFTFSRSTEHEVDSRIPHRAFTFIKTPEDRSERPRFGEEELGRFRANKLEEQCKILFLSTFARSGRSLLPLSLFLPEICSFPFSLVLNEKERERKRLARYFGVGHACQKENLPSSMFCILFDIRNRLSSVYPILFWRKNHKIDGGTERKRYLPELARTHNQWKQQDVLVFVSSICQRKCQAQKHIVLWRIFCKWNVYFFKVHQKV